VSKSAEILIGASIQERCWGIMLRPDADDMAVLEPSSCRTIGSRAKLYGSSLWESGCQLRTNLRDAIVLFETRAFLRRPKFVIPL